MTDDIAAEFMRKMDILIAVSAIAALGGKSQTEQIETLNRAGLLPREIAQLVGTTRNTVSVALSRLKAGGKRPAASK